MYTELRKEELADVEQQALKVLLKDIDELIQQAKAEYEGTFLP